MAIYLWRPGGSDERGHYRPASQYHKVGEDGKTSECEAAVEGENGYVLKEKESVLSSMTCHNCKIGRKVRPGEPSR